jgi:hypothetical protein
MMIMMCDDDVFSVETTFRDFSSQTDLMEFPFGDIRSTYNFDSALLSRVGTLNLAVVA